MLFSDKFGKLILKLLTYVAIKEKSICTLEVVSTVATESVNCRCSENLNALYVFDGRALNVH